ncbi:hypothetical protein BC939DRAFT_508130 [Gamsiella multidivaricata]|uniref:uncharacterized protein n=1 Tax=Gamsiella multidivaricata TaxID=101098 RepID=UPI00222001F6|nr:uncharacterized protein BC939DRAFT_508130 [Gamsiella multidivaricata]KAI7816641.1 hypothetical protein BC939DRAFT_508130 [Gamsiella multidivaricata]
MAGCTHPNERLWLARNTVIPPPELQRQVFPFIKDHFKELEGREDWLQWLENVMMDRNVYHKRQSTKRMAISFSDILKIRMLLLLAHLRKVVLQDAVALMSLPNEPFLYGDHRILQHSVFKGSLFLEFKGTLLRSMETARSPMTDSLSVNTPALHNEFSRMNNRMSRAESELRHLFQESNNQAAQQVKRLEHLLVNQFSSYVTHNNSSPTAPVTPVAPVAPAAPAAPAAPRQQSLKERRMVLEEELGSRYVHYPPNSVDLVDVTMLPCNEPLQRQWDEWFRGVDGRPSLWILNKTFKSKWRKGHGNTLAKTFSFKKTIVYSILDLILNTEGATLEAREESALQVVEDQLRVMTLNRYYLNVAKGMGQLGQPGPQLEDEEEQEENA